MPGVPDDIGEVLVEAPAPGHVEDLHPPANGENGHRAPVRLTQQLELERVALRTRLLRLGVRLLAVVAGIDVGPTGQHQSVDPVEQRPQALGLDWKHNGSPAGSLDGVDVGGGNQTGALGPRAPAGVLLVSSYSDDGPFGPGVIQG